MCLRVFFIYFWPLTLTLTLFYMFFNAAFPACNSFSMKPISFILDRDQCYNILVELPFRCATFDWLWLWHHDLTLTYSSQACCSFALQPNNFRDEYIWAFGGYDLWHLYPLTTFYREGDTFVSFINLMWECEFSKYCYFCQQFMLSDCNVKRMLLWWTSISNFKLITFLLGF